MIFNDPTPDEIMPTPGHAVSRVAERHRSSSVGLDRDPAALLQGLERRPRGAVLGRAIEEGCDAGLHPAQAADVERCFPSAGEPTIEEEAGDPGRRDAIQVERDLCTAWHH